MWLSPRKGKAPLKFLATKATAVAEKLLFLFFTKDVVITREYENMYVLVITKYKVLFKFLAPYTLAITEKFTDILMLIFLEPLLLAPVL